MNVVYIDDTNSDDESMQIDIDYLETPSKPILKRQKRVSFIAEIKKDAPPIERSEERLKSLFKYFKKFSKNR
jgi:hypothetical protein